MKIKETIFWKYGIHMVVHGIKRTEAEKMVDKGWVVDPSVLEPVFARKKVNHEVKQHPGETAEHVYERLKRFAKGASLALEELLEREVSLNIWFTWLRPKDVPGDCHVQVTPDAISTDHAGGAPS